MAQLIVRNLEEGVKTRLRRRAARHGRSMEEEARDILRNAVRKEDDDRGQGIGSEMAALFRANGTDVEFEELRGSVRPASFDQ